MSAGSITIDFNLNIVLRKDDGDLPIEFPDGLAKRIAEIYSELDEYMDGFTDMLIEGTGCDIVGYTVTPFDSRCRCADDEPCPIHY